MKPILVLASSSEQRKALLQQIGIDPLCIAAAIDETPQTNERASDYVQRLAIEKCNVVFEQKPQAIVVAADTTISVDDKIIGKPENLAECIDTLSLLSDATHKVFTGVAVASNSELRTFVCETLVDFRPISKDEMKAYWNTGEPLGKAGSYGIQGSGAIFVRALHGSYSNVVGLPLHEVSEQLRFFGYPVLDLL